MIIKVQIEPEYEKVCPYKFIFEPRCEKISLRGFPSRSDTNQAVQLQKMARGLKFRFKKVEGLYYLCKKTKALISFMVTAKLICVFVFAYAKICFFHDPAHLRLYRESDENF